MAGQSRGGSGGRPRGGARNSGKVRYAVVGLGYISQGALLPGFANARKNSELTALVSDDPKKLKVLGRKYGVDNLYAYEQYDDCLRSGEIDAVYIGLPNSQHREYTERAAAAGIHVLCEKPAAVRAADAWAMRMACEKARVRLMIAYRLHLEPATLEAIKVARSGKLGEIKAFASTFTMQVKDKDNIRLRSEEGAGPLHDIGIYCINAARMFMRAEPLEVTAVAANSGDSRFKEVPEAFSVVMRYPGERLASFTCSFGAADVSEYRVIGTRGSLCMEPAYEYEEGLTFGVTIGERTKERQFKKKDQFGAELLYFSECVQKGRDPEPSGMEGENDLRIIEAVIRSARSGRPEKVGGKSDAHPQMEQKISRPGVAKEELVNANPPGEA